MVIQLCVKNGFISVLHRGNTNYAIISANMAQIKKILFTQSLQLPVKLNQMKLYRIVHCIHSGSNTNDSMDDI